MKFLFAAPFLLTGISYGQTPLIDATFDGVANDINGTFAILSNSPANGSGASWNQATGFINRGSAANSTTGAVSAPVIDFTTLNGASVVLTVKVQAAAGTLSSNGIFIGFQKPAGGANAGNNLWNNLGPSFGVVIDGGKRLGAYAVGPGGNADTTGVSESGFQGPPNFGVATSASINDGFTATISVDSLGWKIELTGLLTSTGAAITGAAGSWEEVPFAFSDFTWGMRAAAVTQGSGGSLTLASVHAEIDASGVIDTDGDGLPDGWESANGLNKDDLADAALDADNDGLSNIEEFQIGTNPQNADSDGDGLKDGDEIHGTLNPWSGGVKTAPPGEATHPLKADTDGDGVNDGAEIAAGTDPGAVPPNTGPLFPFIDSDGDGYRDEAETAFGSNPNDPASRPDHKPRAKKPNVVVIYADDMGFNDISAYGALFNSPSPTETPRVNSLAAEGTLFTQAHSSNAVCTPSRYALLTGKYNWREFNGISEHYGTGPIADIPKASDTTIAEFLKTQGYDTAAFGKWHLGGKWHLRGSDTRVTGNPTDPATIDWVRRVDDHAVDHGFDTFRGLSTTINFGPYVFLKDARSQYWDKTLNNGAGAFRDATNADNFTWLSTANLNSSVVGNKDSRAALGDPSYRQVDADPIMIKDVENYFAERKSSGKTAPFFSYVALYSPHLPWALTAPFIGADSAKGFHYGDWMKEVDNRIGRIIDAIDQNGYKDDTIIIFTSDNGPENTAMSQSISFGRDPNGPLRGNKRDVWDGGTRVPFVVRWPGQAAAGLKVSDVVWQGDIFATVAAFLKTELDPTVAPDGESFLNLIHGQKKPRGQRDSIVVAAQRGDLGLKTTDGWKFIDSSGGGNSTSWDSKNRTIPNAAGTNQGSPKQLFHQSIDLGEDKNLISSLTNSSAIRGELALLTGADLLAKLDRYRTNTTSAIFPRSPDNDGDGIPNAYEIAHGLDPDSPADAVADLDGDGSSNLGEFIVGTNPDDASDFFRVIDLKNNDNELKVAWPSLSGRSYTVSWSTDLQTWTDESTLPGTGGELSLGLDKTKIDGLDGIPGNLTRLFARVTCAYP